MRRCLPLVLLTLSILFTTAVVADDLGALIDQHVRGSDEARLKIIDAGVAAIPGLLEVIRTQEGMPAERAARAIGWIAEFAPATSRTKVEWTLVNILLSEQQPLLARQAAARNLWHVASDDSAPVLARFIADERLRSEALWSLQNVPGPVALGALTAALDVTDGAARVAVVETLGRRADTPVALLMEAAQDEAPEIRMAALTALGTRASVSVAEFLEERIAKAASDEEELAALHAYTAAGDGLLAAGDRDAARGVYEHALSKGGNVTDVVVRALDGLGKVGDAETPGEIRGFLRRTEPAIHVAAASALARLPGAEATRVLVDELQSASLDKARPVLSALADRADASALPAVIPFARVDNLDVRLMALRALGRMGEAAACEVILEAYQDPAATDLLRATAFDAYTAIGAAELGRGNADAARGIFESALQMAKTDTQRITALNGLASVADPRSLVALGPSLHQAGKVQDAAVTAYLACADTVTRSGNRDAAIDAYMQLLDAVQEGPRAVEVVQRLGMLGSSVDIGSRSGFVTHWWVIGPFPSDDQYGGTDEVFFPEEGIELAGEHQFGDRKMTWRHQHSLDPQGIVDYAPMFDRKTNAVAYAYAEVTLDRAAEARLHAGSDDSIVVWINGEEVHRFKGPRGLKVGEDKQDITLNAGRNTILIKVVQGPGDWSSSVQLTDRNDQPLTFEQKTE